MILDIIEEKVHYTFESVLIQTVSDSEWLIVCAATLSPQEICFCFLMEGSM